MVSLSGMAQITFDASADKGTCDASNPGADQVTKDGVTIAVSNGAMNLTDQYRCYKSATFTVTSTVGNIQKVEISCTAEGEAKYGPGCFTDATAGSYAFEGKVGTWTGDAASFSMTASTNQVRINTVVVTVAGGSGSQGQSLSVGIVRPTFTAGDGTVTYDTWNYVESVDKFNKSADGLTVKFFQSAEIESTIVTDETQEGGYEIKQVCHQGVKNIPVDYVWKLNCTAGGANKHNDENAIGSENWNFGFDLTVADGKTFNVSAIDFDLLVEQNPAYRIRIMKGETEEVYNSTWITKTGGYNNLEWGAGSYCRIEKDTVLFVFEAKNTDGLPVNWQAIQYYPGFEEKFGVMTPLGDLKLTAGTYRVIADVDYNKDSSKAMSFDNFTIEGTLEGGSTEPEPATGNFVGIVRPTFTATDGTVTYDTWNYIESVDKFNKSADGLTVKFFQSAEIESTIVTDETQEGGYEIKQVCHQGVKNIPVDYVWKLNCTAGGANKHNDENAIGSENWNFGFDLTVADGKTFNVSAIDFDLLVEQNPAYRIRIMKGETEEVYNSTWITKTGGYNNLEWGAGSYCRIEKDTVLFVFEAKNTDGLPVNWQAIQYYPGFEEKFGVMTPLGDLKLTAGTYRVIADVDYNKDSAKAMSFDNFTLEGELVDASNINIVTTANKQNGVMYNLAGQKVGKDYKGIVIQNGRKFMQK